MKDQIAPRKSSVNQVREQLDHYNQEREAAVREISRLKKENDKLKERLKTLDIKSVILKEDIIYLQKMIEDKAFEKMTEQYKLLESLIVSFFKELLIIAIISAKQYLKFGMIFQPRFIRLLN